MSFSSAAFSVDSVEIMIGSEVTQRDLVYQFLSQTSYWAKGIPRDLFEKSLANSIVINAFLKQRQIGFARVITDQATYGYLADVFVLPEFRGLGVSKKMMAFISQLPALQVLRRITLATSDAHGLYQQFGFKALARPDIFMEKHQPNLYQRWLEEQVTELNNPEVQ